MCHKTTYTLNTREKWIGPWRERFAILPTRLFDGTWAWGVRLLSRRYSWCTPDIYPYGALYGEKTYRKLPGDDFD